jgi:hypothetical protein
MNIRYIKRKSDNVIVSIADREATEDETIIESKYYLNLIDVDSGTFIYAHQIGEPYKRDINSDTKHVAWYKQHLKAELQKVIGDNLLDILGSGLKLEEDIVPQWSGFLTTGASMTTITALKNHYNSAIDFLNLNSSFYK